MKVKELLQKVNLAHYEGLEKVVISVDSLLLLRGEIDSANLTISILREEINRLKNQVNNLTRKQIKTYIDIKDL